MKHRILLIDDDEAIRSSLAKVLREEGYEVEAAPGGQEGIQIFRDKCVDLVLLDLVLPGRSGWDVFGTITSINPFIPVVIITGRNNQYDLANYAGASALMEKPLDVPYLIKTIADLLTEEFQAPLRRLTGVQRDIRYAAPVGK